MSKFYIIVNANQITNPLPMIFNGLLRKLQLERDFFYRLAQRYPASDLLLALG